MAQKEKVSRKQQREEARIKARATMEAARRKEKRAKLFIQGGVVLGILLIAGIIVLSIVNQKPPTPQVNPANMISNGVLLEGDAQVVPSKAIPKGGTATPTQLSDGKVLVTVYVDYLCPYCKMFEEAESNTLLENMQTGKVQVEYVSAALLSQYSAVAANASACVASLEPNKWWEANLALFKAQPEESVGQGYSKKSSIDYIRKTALKDVGLSAETTECIKDTRYYDWSVAMSDTFLSPDYLLPNTNVRLEGTPTIIIDGVKFDTKSGQTLDEAIKAAVAAKGL